MIHTVESTITKKYNNGLTTTKDLITHSTFIMVDGRLIRLSYSRLIPYLTPKLKDNPAFADIFLFSKDAYENNEIEMNGKMIRMNHAMYNWIKETNYSKETGVWHELQWDEIKTENKGFYLNIYDSKRNHNVAIPSSVGETRYDYISIDGRYHYDCKPNQFDGIEIIVNDYKFTTQNKVKK